MNRGVSAQAARVRPPTSTPSTSPESMWKTRTTVQRSLVAPRANDAVQGQTRSQVQFSKYRPAIFQDISVSCRPPAAPASARQTGPVHSPWGRSRRRAGRVSPPAAGTARGPPPSTVRRRPGAPRSAGGSRPARPVAGAGDPLAAAHDVARATYTVGGGRSARRRRCGPGSGRRRAPYAAPGAPAADGSRTPPRTELRSRVPQGIATSSRGGSPSGRAARVVGVVRRGLAAEADHHAVAAGEPRPGVQPWSAE